jgi:hypothetical protein
MRQGILGLLNIRIINIFYQLQASIWLDSGVADSDITFDDTSFCLSGSVRAGD